MSAAPRIDWDESGPTTRFHFNEDGSIVVERVAADISHILDANKAEENHKTYDTELGRHIGEIPNIIVERWLNEEFERGNIHLRPFTAEFAELVKQKLRDPDWKWLRTTDKRF